MGEVPPVHPGQLDDVAQRQPGDRLAERVHRVAAVQSEDVALLDDVRDQPGRRRTEPAPALPLVPRAAVAAPQVDDDAVPEPEPLGQRPSERDVDLGGHRDVDPHDVVGHGRVQETGHLEPADVELLGDLHLRPVLQIEAPGDGRGQERVDRAG